MPIYRQRILDLSTTLKHKSCFLFGPRQTGKSTLVEKLFPDANFLDLLDDDIYIRLQQKPKDLTTYILKPTEIVVIDEIQRIPQLLNEVHRLIEKSGVRFLLTGSSARKLRKNGVNLLGGRARSRTLHPFVHEEIKDAFDLDKALRIGSIPSIYFSDEPWDDLKSYVGEYLKEEIIAEAATRNVPAFTRFLEVAAISNGSVINYDKIASDAQVPRSTVQAYYQILRDTLIGADLVSFRKTPTRKATATHKFYFFDLGVVNYLRRTRTIEQNSPGYGEALEAYIHHELSSYCSYFPDFYLSFWRADGGYEVDFFINEEIAIEVKATRSIRDIDLRGLRALAAEVPLRRQIVVCREPIPRKIGSIEILPIEHFLEKLWARSFD